MIQCSRYWVDKDGHYKTKGPEYETVWSFGADCGIDDLDGIAELDRTCGDFGLDTIEMGATMAVYMDSGKLAFGDAEGALKALKSIFEGGEPGRIMGDGAEAVGKAFGVAHIPVVKHQALPAYDPRSVQGIGVTYATSTMGADHTAGYAVATNILKVGGDVDPLKPEGQIELSRNLQIATAMLDALGLCIFVAFPVLDIPEAFAAIHEMAEAHTGDKWDADALMQLGKETLVYEKLFNERAGMTPEDDRLPEFFTEVPLPPHNVVFGGDRCAARRGVQLRARDGCRDGHLVARPKADTPRARRRQARARGVACRSQGDPHERRRRTVRVAFPVPARWTGRHPRTRVRAGRGRYHRPGHRVARPPRPAPHRLRQQPPRR